MATAQKISIALTKELNRDIQTAVSSGEYASSSEVVRDALRGWKREREERELAVKHLQQMWLQGVESGEPIDGNFDAEEIIRRGRARLSRQTRSPA